MPPPADASRASMQSPGSLGSAVEPVTTAGAAGASAAAGAVAGVCVALLAAASVSAVFEAIAPSAAPPGNADTTSAATRTNCTVSPGCNWPSFHSSSRTTVTGHTKPPRLGPSGPRITGMSPVKSTAPIAYALSWMFDGCRPASPPSARAHCGFGPISRTPVRLEL